MRVVSPLCTPDGDLPRRPFSVLLYAALRESESLGGGRRVVRRLPTEVVASLLAATTVLIALPPYNLPPWAVFISWAGTFAAGGPTRAVLKRIWPALPVGATYALAIVLLFEVASRYLTGAVFTLAEMIIIFAVNTCLMYTARLSIFSSPPTSTIPRNWWTRDTPMPIRSLPMLRATW